MQPSAPCVLSLPKHIAQTLKEDVSSITTPKHVLKVKPVDPGPLIFATLQIVNFISRVGVAILISKVSPKDINHGPTSTLQTFPKFLRLLL